MAVKVVAKIAPGRCVQKKRVTAPMVYAIWQVMFGSGCRIGMGRVIIRNQIIQILPDHQKVVTAFFVAVVGSTMPGTCARLFASGTGRAAGTTLSAFVAPGTNPRILLLFYTFGGSPRGLPLGSPQIFITLSGIYRGQYGSLPKLTYFQGCL